MWISLFITFVIASAAQQQLNSTCLPVSFTTEITNSLHLSLLQSLCQNKLLKMRVMQPP